MNRVNTTNLLKRKASIFLIANSATILWALALVVFPPANAWWPMLPYLLLGIGIQGLSLALWARWQNKKPFNEPFVSAILYFDLALAYFVEFPFSGATVFFIVIPAFILLGAGLILSGKYIFRVALVALSFLMASAVVFAVSEILPFDVSLLLTQFILFPLMLYLLFRAKESLFLFERENRALKSYLQKAKKETKELKQRLIILQQGSESLSKDVKRREIEIQNIMILSEQMNIGKDSKEILRSFLLTALGQLGSAHAFIMTKERKEQNYWSIVVEKGLRSMHAEDIRIYLDGNFISLLRSLRAPMFVKEMPKENLYTDELDFLKVFSDDVICPIFVNNRLIGLVAFGAKISGKGFNTEDLNLISIVANQSAFVLDQVQKADDYRDQFSRTVRAMLYALEAKYMFTRGHLLRTTNYVTMTARKMGFSKSDVQQMGMGSILHDIGKTAVRDKYLLYDGSLSDTAKDLRVKERILTHAVEGGRILKAAGFSSTLVDMALHHHEYFNGQGFPDRIAGDEIPIQTRILATCNAYDAMTSDRPYRKALSKEVARNVLEQQAGQQFDPEVVKAFLDVLKNSASQPMYH